MYVYFNSLSFPSYFFLVLFNMHLPFCLYITLGWLVENAYGIKSAYVILCVYEV